MEQKIQKKIEQPQHISFLVPTRGRPESLYNFFASLEDSTRDKSKIDAWVYVDEDDVITRERIDNGSFAKFSYKINWVIRERAPTLGAMLNRLYEICATNPGIYSPAADDYMIQAKEWDVQVRDAFCAQPDQILLAYPTDPTAVEIQVTWPILSASWTNALGRFATGLFPYWFEDTWLDQVAQLVNRKVKLGFRIEPQGGKGKTQRMRNLVFWQLFFDNLLENRVEDATCLLRVIAPPGTDTYAENEAHLKKIEQQFRDECKSRDLPSLAHMETIYADVSENKTSPLPGTSYFNAEMKAVSMLYAKMTAAAAQKNSGLALRYFEAISHSSIQFRQSREIKTWLAQEADPSRDSSKFGARGLLKKMLG